MQSLALELFREASDFGNILLDANQIWLCIGGLALQIGDILHEVVDVSIQGIVFVLIAHDFFFQDALLSLQFKRVFIQVVYLATSGIIIQL